MPEIEPANGQLNRFYSIIKEKASVFFNIDRFFTFLQEKRLEKQYKAVLLLFVSLMLSIVVYENIFIPFRNLKVGEPALRDIRAPQNLKVLDETGTKYKIDETVKGFKPYYIFAPGNVLDMENKIKNAFEAGRKIIDSKTDIYTVTKYKLFSDALGKKVNVKSYENLIESGFSKEFENALILSIDFLKKEKIINKKELNYGELNKGLILNFGGGNEKDYSTIDNFLDIDNAVQLTYEKLQGILTVSNQKYLASLKDVIAGTVTANVIIDTVKTDEKLNSLKSKVEPEYYEVKAGEVIVKGGEVLSGDDMLKLNALFKAYSPLTRFSYIAGIGVVFALLLFLIYVFAAKSIRKISTKAKDLTFLSVTLVGSIVLIKIYTYVAGSMTTAFPYIPVSYYSYALPVAAAAMLVRLILNSEIALIFSFILSILVGVILDFSLPLTVYSFLSCIMGAQGVAQCQDRGTITRAGIKVGFVNLVFIAFFTFLQGRVDIVIFFALLFAFAGGIFSSVMVIGLTQIFESLFNYTTNIKLLELANLENPLLKQMMVQAPGSYHHSIVIGTMVEAVAPAVRANPLLCKVAAYYHDIGKMKKPLYFIENQIGCENKHDKLSPHMSSLVIMSHVKDGMELAKKYKLGEKIIEIIQQHHGTGFISFFYQKAKSLEDKSIQAVFENDFRYPGPKPQSREAAIVMLADAVEAASKTLHDPTPARIQGMVQKIINNIFTEGQLDECDLTLKDLHQIAKVFVNVLTGMLHQRVDYFEPVTKEYTGRKKGDESFDSKPPENLEDRPQNGKKKNGENLKRLGIKKI